MVFLLLLFREESWFIEKVCNVTQAGLELTTSLVMTLYPGSPCLHPTSQVNVKPYIAQGYSLVSVTLDCRGFLTK